MSLFSALSVAVTSVNTLNAATRVVSDNVANATNPNYNRRISQYANLQFGGVQLADIERAANSGLLRDLYQQISTASGDGIRDKLYQQLEQLVGTINGQTPLVDEFESLRTAFKALEASPESDAAQNDVLIAADGIVSEIERLSNGIDLIEDQILNDIEEVVTTLNESLQEVDRLNAQIVIARASGRPTSNLENLRDEQAAEVAKIAQIRTFERTDGTLSIYTTSGIALVDSEPETFSWNTATRVLTSSGSSSTNLVTSGQLPDGQLGSLLNFIRTDSAAITSSNLGTGSLEKFRNQLDELAFSLADDSTARTSGTTFVRGNADLTTSGIVSAGQTLTFTVGAVNQGTVTINAGDSIDDVLTAINAINQVRARVDGHGNLQILSDGGQFTIGGTAAAGFGLSTSQVSADSEVPLAYAYKMEHAAGTVPLTTGTTLSSINGVNVGDQITFNNASLGGAVTYTIGAGDTVQTLLDTINAQDGMYARLGAGNVLEITSDDGSLAINEAGVGTALTGLGFTVNGTNVSILGTATSAQSNNFFVAESGTTPLDISRTNFGLATALSNRSLAVKTGNRTEVVQSLNAGARAMSGSGISTSTRDYTGLSNAVTTGLTQLGNRATRQSEESFALRSSLEQSLRDEVGVDIDEEMANLAVLQNAYAATARVIDTINQMFQALELAGR
ncbi:MAG: flagellar basal body rod C-terminal domain-containing protein [Alphaproteobacteria bacterium]|nr:flagellar basal body rod C-terminal domain-containing protein [Alphaproteobacteria bacterium]